VAPLVGLALAHAEQASWDDVQRVGFQGDQKEEQPVLRRRQGAVLIHAKRAGRPGFPIKAPYGHVRVERGREGRDQRLKLVQRQAGAIQEFQRAGLSLSAP
jgi:hypothetical protein